jgi:hypothetical protein
VRAAALALAALVVAPAAAAQSFRARIDARAQAVSFRAGTIDSVPAADVVPGPTGGPVSPAGFAVQCPGGPWCYFVRPGPERRGVPVSTSGSVVFWGLGVPGLSVHAAGRVVADAGDADVWPGSRPAVQLLEGYLELARARFTARAGRVLVASRLEPVGFDGGWGRLRWPAPDLEFTAYGGWGLGQAAAVPVTSPVLNPLDEWRPRDRQLVAGAEAAWAPGPADVRLEYRREVDPGTDYFVSERAALSFTGRPWRALRAAGGADYNLAEGHLGSADLAVSWLAGRWSVTAGGRRYRPFFSLWTLWGAFSPVPYHAVHGSAQATVTDWLALRARGERYWYDDAEASTPLVDVVDRGWRVSAGVTLTPGRGVTVDGSWLAEVGPGAASQHVEAQVALEPVAGLSVAAYGGWLERPLELRYYDAEAAWIGGRAEWRAPAGWRLWADAAWFDERRDRPDAGAVSLDQVRLRSGLSVAFGSAADRRRLPPARRGRP